MNKKDIYQLDTPSLIAIYANNARNHLKAMEKGNYKLANKSADLIAQIFAELRARGIDAQRSLLPLLHDENPGIRLWAAAHSLEFSPSDGELVLEALVSAGQSVGFDAQMTLREWREGRLRFP